MYRNGQRTLRSIAKWEKREVSDEAEIYRPQIDTQIHTDFYLNEDDCYFHWWYDSDLHFGERRRPPYKQKFKEYLSSLESYDLFMTLDIMQALSNLLRIDDNEE